MLRNSGYDGLLAPECVLERREPGVYERLANRTWWAQGCLHGGYVLALAMTAVEEELATPGMWLQQLSLQYLRPFVDGPLRVHVAVERTGRRFAGATVRMESAGRLAGVGVASVAARSASPGVELAPPPRVAAYDPEANDERTASALGLQVRTWIQPRDADVDAEAAGRRTAAWIAPRAPEPIDHRWIAVLVDLLVPPVARTWDTWRGFQTVDLTYHARAALPGEDLPAGSPLLVVVTSKAVAGGLVDEDVEVWSPAGALLAQTRQMRLVGEARSVNDRPSSA